MGKSMYSSIQIVQGSWRRKHQRRKRRGRSRRSRNNSPGTRRSKRELCHGRERMMVDGVSRSRG